MRLFMGCVIVACLSLFLVCILLSITLDVVPLEGEHSVKRVPSVPVRETRTIECRPLLDPGNEDLNSEWKICMGVEAE